MPTAEPGDGATLEALSHYLNANANQRQTLRSRWAAAADAGDPDAGLRYALALAATGTDDATLREAEGVLTTLLGHDALKASETTLARLALNTVQSRLAVLGERQQLVKQRNDLRAELHRAQEQIEQLTRIEQELEPEAAPPPQGLPDGRD